MSGGLQTTMKVLGETANEAAVAVLLAALDSRDHSVQEAALRTLVLRRSLAAEIEVLRRWDQLSDRWKSIVVQKTGWLTPAVRKAVLANDSQLYRNACDAAIATREYHLIPQLVAAARDKKNPFSQRAASAVLELAEHLHDEIHSPRDYRIRRDPRLQRAHVLPSLELAAETFPDHGRTELTEAFLLLAGRDNAVLKHILQSPGERSHAPLIAVLGECSRPAIVRLLLSYLDDPHAPLAALQVIAGRTDISFLRLLFRKIGAEPATVVRANLKRIESAPCLRGILSVLTALGDAEQAGVVQFAALSGISRKQALDIVAFVLGQEPIAGRRAAAVALAQFTGRQADQLALKALSDDDPQVRAAILSQLRPRDLPGATARLLEYLDSPHEVEREAARKGLEEYTFSRYLVAFDGLADEARRSTAKLVKAVDSRAIELLRTELQAPSRSRRKRALEICVAMDAVEELQPVLVGLLSDENQYFKIEVIRTLEGYDLPDIRAGLRQALLDHHPLVQQAAERALMLIAHNKTEPVSSALTSTTVSPRDRNKPSPESLLPDDWGTWTSDDRQVKQ
jgi:HEAT repeat protein